MELIELQCDDVLKAKFKNVYIKTFFYYAGPIQAKIKELAAKTISIFASTYVCELLFSLMNFKLTGLDLSSIDGCIITQG